MKAMSQALYGLRDEERSGPDLDQRRLDPESSELRRAEEASWWWRQRREVSEAWGKV
jgi:hypothetical protein